RPGRWMRAWSLAAIVFLIAFSEVGESVRDPGKYWRNNLLGSLTLVEAMLAAGCGAMVFSSTCATYGEHDGVLLDENTPQRPVNSYGASKRAIEEMLDHFGTSHGLRSVVFRYFNVAGADPEGEIGEAHDPETHLIPVMIEAIRGLRPGLTIHGTDYDTRDGTCIRDYVHVMDLVEAHVAGLRHLLAGGASRVFNLGTGRGFSVREVIDHARRVTNLPVPASEGPRRAGDCAVLVSGSHRAEAELGWRPERSSMEQMIADAWAWHTRGARDC
ncbi:MAG: UDP-glucose 4-epimerase GalE, partial [Rhodobacteraceae bacterium]|nr:UDP-glucose 4-epimerase GalE [Paracoccaceae bacterium]